MYCKQFLKIIFLLFIIIIFYTCVMINNIFQNKVTLNHFIIILLMKDYLIFYSILIEELLKYISKLKRGIIIYFEINNFIIN